MNTNRLLPDQLDLVVVEATRGRAIGEGGTSAAFGAVVSCSCTVSRTMHNSCTGHPSGNASVSASRHSRNDHKAGKKR